MHGHVHIRSVCITVLLENIDLLIESCAFSLVTLRLNPKISFFFFKEVMKLEIVECR